MIDLTVEALPTSVEVKDGIKNLLKNGIDGILVSTVTGATFQAVYTWIIFDFAGIHYVYLWCLAASFFKMLPFVATVLIGLLGALQYFFCTCYGD